MLTTLNRPLRVGVLCSGRAPGLLHLLNADPRRGTDYDVVCCISSEETFAEEVRVERRGVPCVPHPMARFTRDRGVTRRDLAARAEYDRETLALLQPYHPDLLLLDGYLFLVTEPLLDVYRGRMINVHHADLLRRTPEGAVAYPGLRAVRDAFLAGERETRATAHVVTERLDDGPVLLRSWAFPVPPIVAWARDREASDVLRASAWAHTEWMLREAWGPMLSRVVELASLAFAGPGEPLDTSRVGRWALAPDGAFTPDGALLESVT